MSIDIAANSIVLMCTAAAPNSAANGGSDDNFVEITGPEDTDGRILSFDLDIDDETVDITGLDNPERAHDFIQALEKAMGSAPYVDTPVFANSIWAKANAIKNGILHPQGRGKVDLRILVGGAVTGNTQIDGTLIITKRPMKLAAAGAIGGTFSYQFCGVVLGSAQT